jgi:hypothetical protein
MIADLQRAQHFAGPGRRAGAALVFVVVMVGPSSMASEGTYR